MNVVARPRVAETREIRRARSRAQRVIDRLGLMPAMDPDARRYQQVAQDLLAFALQQQAFRELLIELQQKLEITTAELEIESRLGSGRASLLQKVRELLREEGC